MRELVLNILAKKYFSKSKLHYNILKRNQYIIIVVGLTFIILICFGVGIFSIFPSVIVSGSMEPEIKVGDIILIKKIAASDVSVGDVIQFKSEDKRIAHRVLEIKGEKDAIAFVTKGDSNLNPDQNLVLAEQVVGNVIGVIPNLGWISVALNYPQFYLYYN